ncbi:MAG: PhzF family phenazine biosynthesis protein [Sphingomonadaceae bacterium]|nr:PhzF family phenazine biosynthesis protein [Sphingomonadaceae bacterium]
MQLRFTQVDAFAERPFTGNQACVMPLTEWLPDSTLRAIANENNVAETAFYLPDASGAADFELRWFTPAVEVALCGHATLASGHVALGDAPGRQRVTFVTRRSGVLAVERAGDGYALDLPAMAPTASELPGLAGALGAVPEAVLMRGHDYVVGVFARPEQVLELKPDFRALAALPGGDVLVIATAAGGEADVTSRVFAPGAGVDEDPVTGSAHAIIAPYWAERLGRAAFSAHQASARGGRLKVELRGDIVRLTGGCVTVIDGTMHL